MEERTREFGWPIVLGVAAFVIAMNFLLPSDLGKSTEFILSGVYVWVIGLLFLLAYYFEEKAIVFRSLIWVCEHFSSPRGRKMAFFYFGLAAILGTMAILQGFGVINVARNP
jgi:hypothetical protein